MIEMIEIINEMVEGENQKIFQEHRRYQKELKEEIYDEVKGSRSPNSLYYYAKIEE